MLDQQQEYIRNLTLRQFTMSVERYNEVMESALHRLAYIDVKHRECSRPRQTFLNF
jgi:hypothetical protein